MIHTDQHAHLEQVGEPIGPTPGYGGTLEIVYTWPDGREEVRYRRPVLSHDAIQMRVEVNALQQFSREKGQVCPYSYREVPNS